MLNNTNKGIITIATGAQKYIDMAVNLAMSCKLKSPQLCIALVTDSKSEELKKYFDIIIPYNENYPKGIIHKIYIFDYSPFEETIFIDGDCLLVRDISMMFDWFKNSNVTALGKIKNKGTFFGFPFETLKAKFGIDSIGGINGGLYYFKKNEKTKQIFDNAKQLFLKYDEIGFERFRGGYNEEGLMAVSMACYNEQIYEDQGRGMRTPMQQTGQFKMDILKGYCEFIKEGEKVEPAIMHFGGDCTKTFFYKRELKKLKLARLNIFPNSLISAGVNLYYNIPYTIFIFVYRIAKSIFKGAKFKVLPLMPMHRFE